MKRRIWAVAGLILTMLLVPLGREGSVYSAPETWRVTDTLLTARQNHTATLLPNGRVLVAGGYHSVGGDHYLSSAEQYDPTRGRWSNAGSMGYTRSGATATLLPNGRVLVAGGYGGPAGATSAPIYLDSAEIYDPAAGTWSTADSLTHARKDHTATLLADGRVLIIGGQDGSLSVTDSAEIYDPATDTFTETGALGTGRRLHTATLLPDGRVLVVAGQGGSSGRFNSAEIYDPGTGTFADTTSIPYSRSGHTATLLRSGKVLVTGGSTYGESFPPVTTYRYSAYLYDMAAETWTATANSLSVARATHTATLLPNGKVLVAGGDNDAPLALDGTEIYDPGTNQWTTASDLVHARYGHTATLLPSGYLLVAGGYDGASFPGNAELYEPPQGAWTTTGELDSGRQKHTATLLPDGKVLVTGGHYTQDAIAYDSAEVYDPTTGTWSTTGSMSAVRFYHTATLLTNGKVLVAGGVNKVDGYLSSAEIYDPDTGLWSDTSRIGRIRAEHTATVLADGRVLVAGGRDQNGVLSTVNIYNPDDGLWYATGSMNTGSHMHTATLLPDGRVLVAGGRDDAGVLARTEIYDPATGTWSLTDDLLPARRSHTATLLPDGRVLVTGGRATTELKSTELYDPITGVWYTKANLNTGRDLHTATLLPDGRVLVAGGERYDGGWVQTDTAEVYDPETGGWSTTDGLNNGASWHTATLLADGRVLLVGGSGSSADVLAHTEIYQGGLGFQAGWRPVLNTVPSLLRLNTSLLAQGSGFRTRAEASAGNTQNSATNYPLVQLRHVDSERLLWLQPDPEDTFSDTTFTSVPVSDMAQGPALVTVFVNGIPSTSRLTVIKDREETSTTIWYREPNPSTVGQPVMVQFTVDEVAEGTPTGNVTVGDGSDSCTSTVAQGGCQVTFTSAGAKTITATYHGDENFMGSVSHPLSHIVNDPVKANTTTEITDHTPHPSLVGQAVTVRFTVTSSGGAPTGNVTVSDGKQDCTGTVAIGSCTLTFQAEGVKSLTATYAGDDSFNASLSEVVLHSVVEGAEAYRVFLSLVVRNR